MVKQECSGTWYKRRNLSLDDSNNWKFVLQFWRRMTAKIAVVKRDGTSTKGIWSDRNVLSTQSGFSRFAPSILTRIQNGRSTACAVVSFSGKSQFTDFCTQTGQIKVRFLSKSQISKANIVNNAKNTRNIVQLEVVSIQGFILY